ncbi:MAG: DUF2779 domain-containing protein [Erysipelotrichaceae bacterium]|nr:DUF2779 domain-containing protein [Erysipelotrichaceae bacterium]
MYHISDLKKYIRCPRLFQLSFNEEGTSFNPYVRLDQEVTELARIKLNANNYFLGIVNDEPEKALNAMDNYEWIIKGRFEYKNLRVKVPFLHKNEDGWDLYFLFIGNYPHDDDILFYTSTLWVLINNNIKIKDISIIHLNSKYVREDKLDIDQLFVISKNFYNAKNNESNNIKQLIFKKMKDYSDTLNKMDIALNSKIYPSKKVKACTRFGKCKYYDTCFVEELDMEDNSILTLVSSQYKNEMYQEGIKYLKDVDLERLEGSRKQFAQIMADINGGLFFDKLALKTWLYKLKYPLSFLDFEWETYAIPPYQGMKTYDVLPFQYSLHILEDEKIIHKEFIGENDTRLNLLKSLLNDIPKTGSIIAYNGEAAEKIRIKELAKMFPEYSKPLMKIYSRIVDLQLPFDLGIVYDTRMKGHYSLKMIMSLLNDVGYSELEISQGMDAVFNWRSLDKLESKEEKEIVIENLKSYCAMDTYAMIVVYRWLKKLAE